MNDGHDNREAPTLAHRLALLDRCRRTETRATTQQVASLVAHMIGTPLNVILGRAALLRANPDPEKIGDNLRRIEEQVQRLTLRIQRLIEYLDLPDEVPEPGTARDVVGDAMALYEPVSRHYDCTLRLSGASLPATEVEGTSTLALVTALLSIAIQNAGEEALVVLGAEDDDGDVVFTLEVPGMAPVEEFFEKLDPPEAIEPKHVERTQALAVLAASSSLLRAKARTGSR